MCAYYEYMCVLIYVCVAWFHYFLKLFLQFIELMSFLWSPNLKLILTLKKFWNIFIFENFAIFCVKSNYCCKKLKSPFRSIPITSIVLSIEKSNVQLRGRHMMVHRKYVNYPHLYMTSHLSSWFFCNDYWKLGKLCSLVWLKCQCLCVISLPLTLLE